MIHPSSERSSPSHHCTLNNLKSSSLQCGLTSCPPFMLLAVAVISLLLHCYGYLFLDLRVQRRSQRDTLCKLKIFVISEVGNNCIESLPAISYL